MRIKYWKYQITITIKETGMIHRKMAQRMHTGDEGQVNNLLSAKQTHLQTSPTCHISILTMYTGNAIAPRLLEKLKIKIRSTVKLA